MTIQETPRAVTDHLDLVDRVRPTLIEHVAANEEARRLVDPVVDALRSAGLYRLGVPEEYGGHQLATLEVFDIVTALAGIDSAVAWNVGMAAGAASMFGIFDPELTDAVYAAGPDAVIAVGTFPPVNIAAEGDAYRVGGTIRFLSGAHQARWFVAVGLRSDPDAPIDPDTGLPPVHFVAIPRDDVTLLDTWHVSAMRGTGSTDIQIDDAVLPGAHLADMAPSRGTGAYAAPEYQLGPFAAVLYETAVSIGIARAAIDDLLAIAGVTARAMEMNSIAERPRTQENVGRAEALVYGAESVCRRALAAAIAEIESTSEPLSRAARVEIQLAVCLAAANAAEAVSLVCDAAGTAAARLEHRFERHLRDTQLLERHASKSVDRLVSAGRVRLGLPAGWPTLEG